MIIHTDTPHIEFNAGPIVFAQLLGMTCSICAPADMSKEEVEAAAMTLAEPSGTSWRAIDKSQPPYCIGKPTPNPCNIYPDRLHWFLISDLVGRELCDA